MNSEILLTTAEAAALLRRSPQTLRLWSMTEAGPIKPVRTARRAPLLWRRADLERLINGDSDCCCESHCRCKAEP